MTDHSFSIVIPVYNSAEILPALVERLAPVLQSTGFPHELILVNDGSRDDSWQVICRLARQHPWISGINMMRNYGQHNALLCGIRTARHRVVVTMDDDLQHPPEEIPKLLAKIDQGFDVVYGIPNKLVHSASRNLLSRMTKMLLARAMGIKNIEEINAFRAFRTYLRDAFANYHSPQLLLDVLLSWGTTKFASVPVRHDPRTTGVSNYTFLKLFNQAMLILTGFSTGPLRLASLIGFGFTFFGFGVMVYVVGRYLLLGHSVPGFPFLASIIAIFSGAQLFALGIIGEYLARIFTRSLERPTYIVKETEGVNSREQ